MGADEKMDKQDWEFFFLFVVAGKDRGKKKGKPKRNRALFEVAADGKSQEKLAGK